MIRFNIFGINISVSYFFLSVLVILILIDKSGMLSLSLAAVIFHELGHLLMMKKLKINVMTMDFSLATVKVTTCGILNNRHCLLVAIAGPFMNLLLSLFLFTKADLFIYFGAANFIMFIFNMIPAKGLDGGDLLYYSLLSSPLKNPEKIYIVISIIAIGFIIIMGGALFYITRSNITLILVGIYLLILSFNKI